MPIINKGFVRLNERLSFYLQKIQGWLAAYCNYCLNVQRQGNYNEQIIFLCYFFLKKSIRIIYKTK